MLTPQEVASHSFARATLGGYNMSMVDEFLDLLTEDYTALYNDNAILKNKLKVLSETVEEYRATDTAMRKTLLAAQQMAESMISEAERRKNQLVHDAETTAMARMDELRQQIANEEYRLQAARQATAAYAAHVKSVHAEALSYLEHLDQLVVELPPVHEPSTPEEIVVDRLADAIIHGLASEGEPAPRPEAPAPRPPAAAEPAPVGAADCLPSEADLQPTQRLEHLQHGRDYEIT